MDLYLDSGILKFVINSALKIVIRAYMWLDSYKLELSIYMDNLLLMGFLIFSWRLFFTIACWEWIEGRVEI